GTAARRLGFYRVGRAGIVASRAVLFVTGLEIGLVPAAALEPETRRRHQARQCLLAAFGAFPQRRVADLLQLFQHGGTGFTLVLIDGHGFLQRERPFTAPV